MTAPLTTPTRSAATLPRPQLRPARWLAAIGLGLLCWGLAGCQQLNRRMTIRSDPPGALVLMDGVEVGHTPASVDFTYYATREIVLIKDGFETLTVLQPVPTPWYQVPPVDFVSDNFLPFRVTDRREFLYKLEPQVIVPTENLLDRAGRLRSDALLGP